MFVVFAATGLFLFYCASIPVKFALAVRFREHTSFGAGLSLFEGCYALRSARLRADGEKAPLKWKSKRAKLNIAGVFSAAIHGGSYLMRHVRLEQLRLQGRLCLPDAADTALICGGARMLGGTLAPFVPPSSMHIALQPDFSACASDALFCGMVSVRAGHIISAALIGAWHYLKATRRHAHGKASD